MVENELWVCSTWLKWLLWSWPTLTSDDWLCGCNSKWLTTFCCYGSGCYGYHPFMTWICRIVGDCVGKWTPVRQHGKIMSIYQNGDTRLLSSQWMMKMSRLPLQIFGNSKTFCETVYVIHFLPCSLIYIIAMWDIYLNHPKHFWTYPSCRISFQ